MVDHTNLLLGWLIVAGVCALIGAVIGMGKGIVGPGFFYGLFLGPLGLVLASVAPDERISCPVCRELIRQSATVCPKCRTSMVKLRYDTATRSDRKVEQDSTVMAPPKVIPKVHAAIGHAPRIVDKKPRVVGNVPRAVANVTRFLMGKPPKVVAKPQRVSEKVPRFLICKPGEEVHGPFDLAQIQALMQCGTITSETQFCREGDSEWRSSLIVGLFPK